MEIEYRGANCVVIRDKKFLIVVDPTSSISVKESKKADAVIIATQEKFAPSELEANNFVINMPGEYEHKDVSVVGVAAPARLDSDENNKNAVIYTIHAGDARIAIIGHVNVPIADDIIEKIDMVDILVVPVGGNGYTLDYKDAAAIVKQVTPKVVIPTHYDDGRTKYEVAQDSVDAFLKELSSNHEKQKSLKVKNLPENLTIVELEPTV